MRIAVYYPWVYLTSGIERVILETCKRSRHQYTIFTNHFDRENTYPEFKDIDVVELPSVSVNRSMGSVLKAATTIFFQKIDLSRFDILVVHCDGLGDLILNRNRQIRTVCFCHTPLRPVFDREYRCHVLNRHRGVRRIAFHIFSTGFKAVDSLMWSQYCYVFFNSNETLFRADRGGLLRNLNGNYEVLHPGIDWKAHQPTWHYEPYFLLPGRIMWTKNIETAIRAFVRFKSMSLEHRRFRLVIAGRVDLKSKLYIAELQKISADRDDIEFVISPSDETLWKMYSNCYAVLFPSFNEDWGIVPLEANAYGKPVIATDRGGPKESQLEGQTGYLVPCEPEAFAQAMASLCANEKLVRTIGRAARENARQYDWSYFVNRIDTVLEKIIGEHHP